MNTNPYCLAGNDVWRVLERGIMRTALIVDVHNLYKGCLKKFPGYSINYEALTKEHADLGASLFQKIAYGRQSEDKAETFAKALRKVGFEVRFGGGPYNIDMALTCFRLIEHRAIEQLVIGSTYFETVKIHEFARSRGIYTTVVGVEIPEAFNRVAEPREIDLDVLQVKPNEVHGPVDVVPFQPPAG